MLTDAQLVVVVAGICVLAVAIVVIGRRRRRAAEPRHEAPVAPPGSIVLARTHDGTQYQGALVEDTGAGDDRYLLLSGPILFRRAGGEPESMPPAWDRLAVPRADVAEVWTRSTAVAAPPAAPARPEYDESRLTSETSVDDAITDGPTGNGRGSRRHAGRRAKAPTQ